MARRRMPKGRGSVTYSRSGHAVKPWQARVTDEGKRITLGFTRLQGEAWSLIDAYHLAKANGEEPPKHRRRQPQPQPHLTLREVIDAYCGRRERGEMATTVTARTVDKDRETAEALGRLLDLPLDQIDRDRVEVLRGQLRAAGKKDSWVSMALTLLKRVLRDARDRGLIDATRVDGITSIRVSKAVPRIGKPLSVRQVINILDHSAGTDLEALWSLMLLEGLCDGELGGLRWSHVHPDAPIPFIAITEAVSRKRGVGAILKDPKNRHRSRLVALLPQTATALRALRNRVNPKDDGHVFTNANGGPINAKWIGSRWHLIQDEVGFAIHVRPHDGRTTMATLAGGAATPAALTARMGHAPATMTQHYQHPRIEDQLPIVSYLAELIRAARAEMELVA